MLIVAPIALLLVAAVVLIIVQLIRPGFGRAWLVATALCLATWFLLVYLRFWLPSTLVIAHWQPATLFNASPGLLLDRISWPYAFCLATLAVAILLTATARAEFRSNPYAWAGSLTLCALGLFAVMAANPLTLMAAWAAIDLTELILLLSGLNEARWNRGAVVAFSARVGGIMILFWAVIVGQGQAGAGTPAFDLNHIPSAAGVYILLAAGLRLGVFPLHLPFTQEPRLRRGLGSALRLVPVASSLVLLGRLPSGAIPGAWEPYLLGLSILAALYCSIMWLAAKDELSGRPYWLIAWAAVCVICVIHGRPADGTAWGVAAILPGSLLFLFSSRDRSLLFLPALGLLGLIGLPYTPAVSGWQGLIGDRFTFSSGLILLAQVFLVVGYARHALGPGEAMVHIERWAMVTYPAGLLALVAADVVAGFWGWPGSRLSPDGWAGLVPLAGICLAGVVYYQQVQFFQRSPVGGTLWNLPPVKSARNVTARMMDTLRLDWLYQTAGWVYQGVGGLLAGVSGILEGDGGVLWALAIVSLLVSLFLQGGLR